MTPAVAREVRECPQCAAEMTPAVIAACAEAAQRYGTSKEQMALAYLAPIHRVGHRVSPAR